MFDWLLNFIDWIRGWFTFRSYRAPRWATDKSHLMIQVTPIPRSLMPAKQKKTKDDDDSTNFECSVPSPSEIGDETNEKVSALINKELDSFCKWAGLGLGAERDCAWNLVSGFTTVFIYAHTIPPEGRQFTEEMECLFADVTSSFLGGDQGTELDYQSYSRRCRWAVKWEDE